MTSVSFRAVVESARGGGHVVEVDSDVAEKLGAKHRTRVRGTLDGTEYRSNLISMGGRLVLGVHKATLQAAGRDTGDTVRVTMAIDAEPLPNDEVPESSPSRSRKARRLAVRGSRCLRRTGDDTSGSSPKRSVTRRVRGGWRTRSGR